METIIRGSAPVIGVSYPVLQVSDLDASVAWYTNVLGPEDIRRESGSPVRLCSRRGQLRLALRAGGRPDNRGTLDHIAFSS